MRSWLAILFVLFAAVAVQSEAQVRVSDVSQMQAVRTVLSQGSETPAGQAGEPLFATVNCSVSSRLNGGETMPARSRHSETAFVTWKYTGGEGIPVVLRVCKVFETAMPGSMRAVDRYVFALRKIII